MTSVTDGQTDRQKRRQQTAPSNDRRQWTSS